MRKNTLVAVIFLIISVVFQSTYFIFFQNQNQNAIDNKIVDSIFKSLSPRERLLLLLVTDCDSLFFSRKFIFQNKDFAVDNSKFCNFRFEFEKLLTISDTTFIRNYLEFINAWINHNNFNFYELDFIRYIQKPFLYDTLFYDKIVKIANLFIKYADSRKTLSIPYISNLDTLQKKYYNKILHIAKNNCVLSFDQKIQFQAIDTVKHLKIGSLSIFGNVEDFVFSNFEMIKDVDTQVFSNLLYLYENNKKAKKFIDQKVSKVIYHKLLNQIETRPKKIRKEVPLEKLSIFYEYNLKKKSITVVSVDDNIIKPQTNKYFNILILSSNKNFERFVECLRRFEINVQTKKIARVAELETNLQKKYLNIVIVDQQKILDEDLKMIEKIDSIFEIIFVSIGNLNEVHRLSKLKNCIYAWESDTITQRYLAQAISRSITIDGQIPTSFIKPNKIKGLRLGYDAPEAVGMDSKYLTKIDSLVNWSIRNSVFPGCQVLVVKSGQIVYDKCFGYIDYKKTAKVGQNTLYDIASITKIVATTLGIMHLYDTKKISLDDKFGKYFKNKTIDYRLAKQNVDTMLVSIDTINVLKDKKWKEKIELSDTVWINDSLLVVIDTLRFFLTKNDNIFNVPIRAMLTHTSGIQPALPILKYIRNTNKIVVNIYRDSDYFEKQNGFEKYYSTRFIKDSAEIEVAQNLYLLNKYADTLWEQIKALRVSSYKKYVYSDVNMILLKILIDTITRIPFDKFLNENFYAKMNLKNIAFRPLDKIERKRIAPTEDDKYWRKELIWGTVHDPSAALLGGIAGNAGLFANSFSLAVIGQMLLNKGTYNGYQFFSPETVELFTKRQNDDNRALGFDMWAEKQIISKLASVNTYGHTGFTGNCIWIDPDNELIFIFLSNRVHPNVRNNLINKYKIRQNIHQFIYESIFYVYKNSVD